MKKIAVVTVALLLALSLCGCGETISEQAMSDWNSDWYGWWVIYDTEGVFEGMDGYWWDCCAEFSMNEHGEGSMLLWDSHLTKEDPLAELKLSLPVGEEGSGIPSVENGWFLDAELVQDEWTLDPNTAEYEDMLLLSGEYRQQDAAFTYEIRLRPWGTEWDNVAQRAPEDLPMHYESWYLPLIRAGEPMPDALPSGD